MLFVGVSIVQLQPKDGPSNHSEDQTKSIQTAAPPEVSQNPLLGLIAVILSTLCSGFAGVF